MEVLSMKPETLFLKVVLFLMAIPILAACVFVPGIANEFATYYYPNYAYLQYPFIVGVYGSAIAYFIALYQAFRLLSYIDKNQAFSELSVSALKKIKLSGITISILFTAVLPLIYFVAEVDDAPGLILLGLVVIGASIVIAVFAAVLQKLLQHAIDIKSENDLTV